MSWLLFIATLPGQNSGPRVRFWRQMKAFGAGILRDGVYLLPRRESLRESLEDLRGELEATGASAYVLEIAEQMADLEKEWVGLFDRGEAYRECKTESDALLKRLRELTEPEARRQFRLWRKNLDAIVAIDYFPGEGRERAAARGARGRSPPDAALQPRRAAASTSRHRAARHARLPGPPVGHAPATLGRSHRVRLADPPLHRQGCELRLAGRRSPRAEGCADLRLRRRDFHARR